MRLRFTELLKLLKANDVQITLSGDGMAYDAPQGVMTADIAAEMKRHKADLISYLKLKSSLDETQMRNKIILGASEVVLSSIPDNSIDCLVTEPSSRFVKIGPTRANRQTDNGVPACSRFMRMRPRDTTHANGNPIRNLSYVCKLVEKIIVRHFVTLLKSDARYFSNCGLQYGRLFHSACIGA